MMIQGALKYNSVIIFSEKFFIYGCIFIILTYRSDVHYLRGVTEPSWCKKFDLLI